MTNIQINQVGYRPNDKKIATFRIGDTFSVSDSVNKSGKISDEFRVVDANTGEIVYAGKTSKTISTEYNGEVNRTGDFSSVTVPSKYYIETDDNGKSYEFEIRDDIYDELLKASMKMFYLQRCGQELDAKYANEYAHKACHNTLAKVYGTEKYIDVSGGWHDAGDYGRYIVAAAKSVVDLMMAYDYFPEIMEKDFDVPKVNGIPDILVEIKYELDFMLKMQDEETGGVYHKVTCASFPGFVMPEEETEELIISPISDAATCDFAAAMAYAYRIYSSLSDKYKDVPIDYEDAADVYLAAAKKAIMFLESHCAGAFVNPDGIVTGEYGDDRTIDEYFWAYAEMFKTTGEKKYENSLKEIELDDVMGDFGWKEVDDYGYYAYMSAPWDKDEELLKTVTEKFTALADLKQKNYENDSYNATIYGRFYWGCNMEVANNAMRGIILDRINNRDEYKEMISAQLHYLLGNNPNSKCFVTGFGTNTAVNPHHRPSAAVNKAMPGMLVGGPEPLLLDDEAKEKLQNRPAAKCYLDALDSYSTNEITIYWNSPLVFLLAYMCS